MAASLRRGLVWPGRLDGHRLGAKSQTVPSCLAVGSGCHSILVQLQGVGAVESGRCGGWQCRTDEKRRRGVVGDVWRDQLRGQHH